MTDNETNSPDNQPAEAAAAPAGAAEGTVEQAPETSSQEDLVVELQRKLAEREQAASEAENQMRRLAADFENYRRRQNQERENLIKFAGERILERFLDVLDNFERALEAGRKATEPQQVLTGIELIYKQLQDFLQKEGVAALESKGKPFDPNEHEAVVQQDADDVPDQTVLEEFRKGYVLNGRVLRHAMVKVANNPSIPAVPPQKPESTDESAQTDSARHS